MSRSHNCKHLIKHSNKSMALFKGPQAEDSHSSCLYLCIVAACSFVISEF